MSSVSPIQVAVFLLPLITLLSGVLASNEIPKGWLSIIVPALLLLDIFKPIDQLRIVSHSLREITLILGLVTFLSGFYVCWADNLEYKDLLILINTMFPFLWFYFKRQIGAVSRVAILKAYCYGSVLSALYYLTLIQQVILENATSRSWANIGNSVASNRNDISVFYLVAISAFLYTEFGIPVWLKRGFLCIVTIALLCTFSRSSYLGLMIIIISSVRHIGKKNMLIIAMLMFVLTLTSNYNPFIDRILYTFEAGSINSYDDSTALRVVIWENALKLGLENPLLGIGHGRSPFIESPSYPEYTKNILYAHNYFLTQFFQLGFIGLMLSISMFWFAYKAAVRIGGDYGRFFKNMLAIILILSLTGDPMYGWVMPLFMILLSGVVCEDDAIENLCFQEPDGIHRNQVTIGYKR